jgi:hypothetical protein
MATILTEMAGGDKGSRRTGFGGNGRREESSEVRGLFDRQSLKLAAYAAILVDVLRVIARSIGSIRARTDGSLLASPGPIEDRNVG